MQISQRDILNSIEREMSGDLKEGMKTVGKCVCGVGAQHIKKKFSVLLYSAFFMCKSYHSLNHVPPPSHVHA